MVRLLVVDVHDEYEIINLYGSYESPLYFNKPESFLLKNVLLIPDIKRGTLYFRMINKNTAE